MLVKNILKIGQYLMKLRQKLGGVLFDSQCSVYSIGPIAKRLRCGWTARYLLSLTQQSRENGAFIPSVRMCVCVGVRVRVCVCQHYNTTGYIIVNLGRWIVHDKSWSPVLFEVKYPMSRSA